MPGADWKELVEPIMENCRVELRIIKRGTFTELLIYLETEDATVRPLVEELKNYGTVDLHAHPPGQGKKWPIGCQKIRIRLADD